MLREMLRKIRGTTPWRWLLLGMRGIGLPIPAPLQKSLHFRGWFSTKIAGYDVVLWNDGLSAETALFWSNKDWEYSSLRVFLALAPIASEIVDVGANTGIYAVVSAKANPRARITAIEPVSSNFAALTRNVEKNGAAIRCLHVAATSQNKVVTLWDIPGAYSYSSSLEKSFREGQAVAVPVYGVTLDSVLENIDKRSTVLLKIDVESHEPEVIRGMPSLLINQLCIFLIEVIREGVASEVQAMLGPDQFLYFQVHENDGRLVHVDKVTGSIKQNWGGNYLIVPREVGGEVMSLVSSAGMTINSP